MQNKFALYCAAFVLGLAGCQSAPVTSPGNTVAERPPAVSVGGGYEWSWDISGDRAVRPIQVFSNEKYTWLQMAPHQVMPAIFANGEPVTFDITPPYFVIVGSPKRIDLIATSYRAVVVKRENETQMNVPAMNVQRSQSANRIVTFDPTGQQLPASATTAPASAATTQSRVVTIPASEIPKE